MPAEKDLRTQLTELLQEGKRYLNLQQEYMRYTAAEQLTTLLTMLVVALVCAVCMLVILIFVGMAFSRWLAYPLGGLLYGYLLYAGIILLLLCVVYAKRRTWISLPLARIMTRVFIAKKKEQKNG